MYCGQVYIVGKNKCYCYNYMHMQINEFEGGGVAIGLSCPHMHADPTCATLLLNSWTQTHRGQPITHPVDVYSTFLPHGPPLPNLQTKSTSFYANKSKHLQKQPLSVQMSTATFIFSHAAIKQHLVQIHHECPDATPFNLLAALFWKRVARLKAAKHEQKRSLSVCVDFRKQLRPPLPLGYYGNALHFSLLSLDSEEMDGGGLGHVVERVHHHVSSMKEEEFRSAIEWFESHKEEEGGNKFAPPFRMYGPELTCISMEHMIDDASGPTGKVGKPLMYRAMFDEKVAPVHVSYNVGNVEGEGLIMVMPACPDDEEGVLGRTVMVALPCKELAELCEDQAVLGLHPTILLSGRH